jgi:hypothetical protein
MFRTLLTKEVRELMAVFTKPKRYCTAAQVRGRYGDVSAMWLWRRVKHDAGFPRPLIIAGRQYFDLDQLDAYDTAHIKEEV